MNLLAASRTAQYLCLIVSFGAALSAGEGAASAGAQSQRWLLPLPELDPDPEIPTLAQAVGHEWAADVSSHADIERYLEALAEAAPERARLVKYGETYEKRGLYYIAISSPRNIARVEEIRAANLLLADPRRLDDERARDLIRETPAIVWLSYTVHGNESSGSDAGLLTAYHFLADRRRETRNQLDRVVLIIDPLQNPDGRDRFVNVYRETRGVFPQKEPLASEHTERWPGGRFNHYLFDLNRDWFLQSQAETRAKVAAYLRWHPHVFIDAHEMGRDSTYFFAPPAEPINDMILPRQREWFLRFGKAQGARFDAYGFAYTTREMFDSFYPGYGETWPTLQGAIGILWEQAGVRGLVVERTDELDLSYHDAVRHHYVSGLATVAVAAEHRGRLVEDFHRVQKGSIQLGEEGAVRQYFLIEGRMPRRTQRLARVLLQSGIEVHRLEKEVRVRATRLSDGEDGEHRVPAGAYFIPLAQPAGRLARTLLDRHTDMGERFKTRQLERNEQRLRDEIYDVTAWSLSLAFGVEALASGDRLEVESAPLDAAQAGSHEAAPGAGSRGAEAKLAYLVSGEQDGLLPALSDWLREGLRVRVVGQAFRIAGIDFPRGSLVLRVHENPPTLRASVWAVAARHGVEVEGVDSGFVEEGAHLGGPHVRWVRPPSVALVVDRPTRYSVGHTWSLFDQRLRYPVTRVALRYLRYLDLSKYNVIVFPHGNYAGEPAVSADFVGRLRDWVRQGGSLILVKGAAAWACGEEVQLLSSTLVRKEVKSAAKSDGDAAAPETEPPDAVPGAFLKTAVYKDHWLTVGVPARLDAFFNGNLIFEPLSPAAGRNLVTFAAAGDGLLVSGFCWPRTLELLGGTAYLMYAPLGDGHVIGFADDPNFRAMNPTLQRLFFNAVMFGPGQ